MSNPTHGFVTCFLLSNRSFHIQIKISLILLLSIQMSIPSLINLFNIVEHLGSSSFFTITLSDNPTASFIPFRALANYSKYIARLKPAHLLRFLRHCPPERWSPTVHKQCLKSAIKPFQRAEQTNDPKNNPRRGKRQIHCFARKPFHWGSDNSLR